MRHATLIVAMFLGSTPLVAGALEARLLISPARALAGIPVDAEIRITNTTGAAVQLPRHVYFRVHYLPADEWFVIRPAMSDWRAFPFPLATELPSEIGPGQTIADRLYATPGLVLHDYIGGRNYLRPGTYMIEALLTDNANLELPGAHDRDAEKAIVALSAPSMTPAAEFTVLDPDGDDAKVWSRILDVTERGKRAIIGRVARDAVRQALEASPGSTYVPYYSDFFWPESPQKALQFAESMLERDLPPGVADAMRLRRAGALEKLADHARGAGREAEFQAFWRQTIAAYRELAETARDATARRRAQMFNADSDR